MANEGQNPIKCSNCGEINPPGSLACRNCKADLATASDLPDWLLSLSGESAPPEKANPPIEKPIMPASFGDLRPAELGSTTGDLPDWLRDYGAEESKPVTPKTGELSFRSNSLPNDIPLFDPQEDASLQPFELAPSERGMDSSTNQLKMPRTEDLGAGVPDWLKDLTNSNSPVPTGSKPKKVLQNQPVFEPTKDEPSPVTGPLPDWLADEAGGEKKGTAGLNVADWAQNPSMSGTDITNSGRKYSDKDMEKLLEEAFTDDNDEGVSTTRDLLANFELEELPPIEDTGLTTRPPEMRGLTAELRYVPGMNALGFDEEDEEEFDTSDIPPLDNLFTEVTDDFSQVVKRDKLTGFLSLPKSMQPGDVSDEISEEGLASPPWGEGLAPWLVTAPMPTLSGATAAPNIEPPSGAVIGTVATPPPELPTRSFSMRDLLKQTDELLAENAAAGFAAHEKEFDAEDIAPLNLEELEQFEDKSDLMDLPPLEDMTISPLLSISVPKTLSSVPPPPASNSNLTMPTMPTIQAIPSMGALALPDFGDEDDEFELIAAPEPEIQPFAIGEELGVSASNEAGENNLPKLGAEEPELPDWFSLAEQGVAPGANEPGRLGSAMQTQVSAFQPNIGAGESAEWGVKPPAPSSDWLKDLGVEAAPPTTNELEGADWLKDLRGDISASPASNEPETSDWLKSLGMEEATPPPLKSETPDWLQSLGSDSPAVSSGEPESADWLKDLGVTAASPTDSEPNTSDWLQGLGMEEATPVPKANTPLVPGEPESSVEEMPDWLRASLGGTAVLKGLDSPTASAAPAPAPSSTDADDASVQSWKDVDMPDWLKSQVTADNLSAEIAASQASTPAPMSAPFYFDPEATIPIEPKTGGSITQQELDSQKISESVVPFDPFGMDLSGSDAPISPVQDEVPAWLKTNNTAQNAPATEAPDWLEAMGSGTEAPTPIEDEPSWLAAMHAGESTQNDMPKADASDWLGSLGSASEASAPLEDVPSWLEAMSSGASVAPQKPTEPAPNWLGAMSSAAEASAPIEDVPSWLEAMGSGKPVAPKPPTEATPSAPADEAAPAWIAGLQSGEAQLKDGENTGEVPDWLKAFASGQSSGRDPSAAPKSYSSSIVGAEMDEEKLANLPDWLKEAGATPAPTLGAGVAPVVAPTSRAASQPVFTPASEMEATLPLPNSEKSKSPLSNQTDHEISDLLRDLGSTEDDLGVASMPEWLKTQPDATIPLQFGSDIPEWLNEGGESGSLSDGFLDDHSDNFAAQLEAHREEEKGNNAGNSAATMPIPPATNQPNLGDSFFEDIDAPSWLRNTSKMPLVDLNVPSPPPMPKFDPSATVPSWLGSIGGSKVGEAPSTVGAALASAPSATATYTPPEVTLPPTLASAAILSTLIKEHPTASDQPKTKKPLAISADMLLRWGLFVVLILTALAGVLLTPLTVDVTVTPSVQSFYNNVQSLQADQKVLVVYDWEADKISEMRPLSQVISQHVMSRRARLITFSLNPQGPALANQILDPLATKPEYGNASSGFYIYGNGYLNLGWRPGDVAALRSIFNNLGTLPDYKGGFLPSQYNAMKGINKLSDFDLIIVLAGDENSVRTWIEQAGIQPGARLLMATPQSVELFAKPYTAAPPAANPDIITRFARAQGLVSGIEGAAQYQKLLQENNITADRNLDLNKRLTAQTYAALALVIILVIANFVYLARRLGTRG